MPLAIGFEPPARLVYLWFAFRVVVWERDLDANCINMSGVRLREVYHATYEYSGRLINEIKAIRYFMKPFIVSVDPLALAQSLQLLAGSTRVPAPLLDTAKPVVDLPTLTELPP